MAPRKRKATDGDEDQAKPQGQDKLRRVTRSMSRQPDGEPSGTTQPKKDKPKAKGKAKASTAVEKKEEDDAAVAAEEEAKAEAATAEGSNGKTVIVEHWSVFFFSFSFKH